MNPRPPLPPITRLSPRVIRILGGNPSKFTLQGTNTHLIGTGRHRLLIDTGEGKAVWKAGLQQVLRDEKARLRAVILTHGHGDHVGGVGDVRALAGEMGRGEDGEGEEGEEGLEEGEEVEVWKFLGEGEGDGGDGVGVGEEVETGTATGTGTGTGTKTGTKTATESKAADQKKKKKKKNNNNNKTPLHPITDGQIFAVEGATLRALHTPGHTADHMCFVLEEEQALFTGDAVLGHGTAVFEDLGAYMDSLERMLREVTGMVEGGRMGVELEAEAAAAGSEATSAASGSGSGSEAGPASEPEPGPGPGSESSKTRRTAYPSHGDIIADGAEKIREYIAHRKGRETEALDLLLGKNNRNSNNKNNNNNDNNKEKEKENKKEKEKEKRKKSPSGDEWWSSMEMVREIYADYPEQYWVPAEGSLRQVLGKLEREGKVRRRREGDGDGKWAVVGGKAAL